MSYMMVLLRSERPSSMRAKLHTVAASNNRVHLTISPSSSPLARTINCSPGSQALLEVTHQDHYCCLLMPHIYGVVLRAHSVCGKSRIQRNASGEVATMLVFSLPWFYSHKISKWFCQDVQHSPQSMIICVTLSYIFFRRSENNKLLLYYWYAALLYWVAWWCVLCRLILSTSWVANLSSTRND